MESASHYPNLFLVGAPKAGTSALADALARHPEIFCSKKEPRFFDAPVFYDDPNFYPVKDMFEYLDYFDTSASRAAKYRLDASVFNMYSADSIERIKKMNPSARFLLVLRDPLTATKSMFMQRLNYVRSEMREISDNFCECWAMLKDRAIGEGLPAGCKSSVLFRYDFLYHYENFVPNLVDSVGWNNILILRYEDYKSYPDQFYSAVIDWLGLEYMSEVDAGAIVNPSVAVKNGSWNRFINLLMIKTLPIRRVLGLTGSRVVRFKSWANKAMVKQRIMIGNDCDDSVIEEFNETYRFLDDAERSGLISRVVRES